MKERYRILLSFFLALSACHNSSHNAVYEQTYVVAKTDSIDVNRINDKSDTSNQYIYDFMRVVMADQKIDSTYGLILNPGTRCNSESEDSIFLRTLLLDEMKSSKPFDYKTEVITSGIPKWLTREDIRSMLMQKTSLSGFHWNNFSLGFNLSNKKKWYSFSIPLFSRNRQKAIICIEELCPGLCGNGKTILFTRKNKKWISEQGLLFWYY